MSIDGYLILKRGAESIVGECLDAEFGSKGAIDIDKFSLGVPKASGAAGDDDDDNHDDEDSGNGKKKKSKKAASPGGFRRNQKGSGWIENSSLGDLEGFTFSIDKQVDASSPDLFFAYCKTTAQEIHPYEEAIVYIRKSGGPKPLIFLQLTFYEVYVVEYNLSVTTDAEADGTGSESITFCFGACEMKYWKQRMDGSLDPQAKSRKWDFPAARNKR